MLYKNYRIESSRLKKWDYKSEGIYFITICTKYMDPVFGYINNGKMILSEIGNIVDKYWRDIPNHFPFVQSDEYVVMPNHIHGIIIILSVETLHRYVFLESKVIEVESTLMVDKNKRMSKISPKQGSISAIIRSYKSICTKTVNQRFNSGKNMWQPRFYDHIVRSETDLNRIREYIKNNPGKWNIK